MLYERIFREFAKVGLDYVVIGGIAVNLHGYARATGDLDIVVMLKDEDLKKFVSAVRNLGFVPRLPVQLEDLFDAQKRQEWLTQKNMKVFSVYNPKDPIEHIDLMCDEPVSFVEIFKNRVIMRNDDLAIPIASIADIIRLKEAAGRGRDLSDIEALKKIQEIRAKES